MNREVLNMNSFDEIQIEDLNATTEEIDYDEYMDAFNEEFEVSADFAYPVIEEFPF